MMNFDFIQDHTEKHDEHVLTITGLYEDDIITKVIAELGTGKHRQGVLKYYEVKDERFTAEIIV